MVQESSTNIVDLVDREERYVVPWAVMYCPGNAIQYWIRADYYVGPVVVAADRWATATLPIRRTSTGVEICFDDKQLLNTDKYSAETIKWAQQAWGLLPVSFVLHPIDPPIQVVEESAI